MNYVRFCRNYALISNIPVTLMKGKMPLYSSLSELLALDPMQPGEVFWDTGFIKTNPTFCSFSPETEYGCVHIEGSDYYIVLGPVFSVPVSDSVVRTYIKEIGTSPDRFKEISEYLHTIPLLSHTQFQRHLLGLHISLNDAEVPQEEIFQEDEFWKMQRGKEQAETLYTRFEEKMQTTYPFEQQLYAAVRGGNTEELEQFLQKNTLSLPPEGRLASTPLRHAKDLFIVTVTKVEMLAAIPAGIAPETAYPLADLYIQECERIRSPWEVQNLMHAMLLDFCRRCGELRLPDGLSDELRRCLSFIHTHITDSIGVEALAEHMGRSPSYLHRLFRRELGSTINNEIVRSKLEYAKKLLAYSSKSLVDISCLLEFSSQSYFQNIFKKMYGITPMQYRKQAQRH